ncbi:Gfo/Idh/MocA family oxidoreductase [bacterium]|nr:Gfo/Idh/MocA family oxidoreductase [bacterium]
MKLKIGIAGLMRGKVYVDCFRKAGIEINAFCDANEQVLRQAGKEYNVSNLYSDYNEFLNSDIDAVVVATPLSLHTEHSIAALKADKHVLSEVPPVNSIEEAKELKRAVKETKAKYMLAQNTCYWAHIQAWRRMIKDGKIGKIIYAETEFIMESVIDPRQKPTWRATMPPICYCTHSLGPLLSMIDDRCVSAQGFKTEATVCKTKPDAELGIFRTEKGAIIKLLVGFGLKRKPRVYYWSIYGTKGCLETHRDFNNETTLAYFDDIPHLKNMINIPLSPDHVKMNIPGMHGGTEHLLVKDFVESILEDKPAPIGINEALSYGLPGICAHQSAMNNGEEVEIPVF